MSNRTYSNNNASDLPVGAAMPDGTVFAGVSPDTGKPFYALPADEPLRMTWDEAMKYAAAFEGHGRAKGSFRLPTDSELAVLHRNSSQVGGFNEALTLSSRWYWSSRRDRQYGDYAWGRSMANGELDWDRARIAWNVRLVTDGSQMLVPGGP